MSTAGPNNPGTVTTAATFLSVTGLVDWTNPTNVEGSSAFATAVITNEASGGYESYWLKATNFSLGVPSGATINGITATLARKEDAGSDLKFLSVILIKSNAALTGSASKVGSVWSTSTTDEVFGSSSDLWSASPVPTDSDVNDSTFGVAALVFNVSAVNASRTASVQNFRITVTYTAAGGGVGQCSTSGLFGF